MGGFFGFFSNIFGYVLNAIYNIDFIRNYGVAIILFTILVKVVLLPITIKQQKTMKKTAKIQAETKKLQEKYKGDQERINKEMLDLYKRENMSPCSGCLSGLIQIILLLAVFYLISQPLTYMRKIDKGIIDNHIEQIKQESPDERITYPEITVIRHKGAQDENVNINMEFLGLDLSTVPSGDMSNFKVYIIPVLYIITSVVSIKISTNMTKKKKKDAEEGEEKKNEVDFASQMSKNMVYIMPLMAIMISFVAPLGLALYWLVNNVLTIAERILVDKLVKEEEE